MIIIIEPYLEQKRPLKFLLMCGFDCPTDETVAHLVAGFLYGLSSGDAIVGPNRPNWEQLLAKEIWFYASEMARCEEVSGLFS